MIRTLERLITRAVTIIVALLLVFMMVPAFALPADKATQEAQSVEVVVCDADSGAAVAGTAYQLFIEDTAGSGIWKLCGEKTTDAAG
jgi:hypothetical protein